MLRGCTWSRHYGGVGKFLIPMGSMGIWGWLDVVVGGVVYYRLRTYGGAGVTEETVCFVEKTSL